MGKSRLVMAFGAFDLLHPGHVLYLKEAKRLGDRLMVVVARDSSIRLLKHGKPAMGENARLSMVGSLKMVDRAILGNRLAKPKDRYNILKKYRPDVIAFGYDQRVDLKDVREWLRVHRLKIRVVSIRARKNAGRFKSSKLKRKFNPRLL